MSLYRIVLIPEKAQWAIQLQSSLFMWKQVGKDLFPNHAEAMKRVRELGLDAVYRPYNGSFIGQVMDGGRNDDHRQQNYPAVIRRA